MKIRILIASIVKEKNKLTTAKSQFGIIEISKEGLQNLNTDETFE